MILMIDIYSKRIPIYLTVWHTVITVIVNVWYTVITVMVNTALFRNISGKFLLLKRLKSIFTCDSNEWILAMMGSKIVSGMVTKARIRAEFLALNLF